LDKSNVVENSNAVRGADPLDNFMAKGSVTAAKNIGPALDGGLQNRIVVGVADNEWEKIQVTRPRRQPLPGIQGIDRLPLQSAAIGLAREDRSALALPRSEPSIFTTFNAPFFTTQSSGNEYVTNGYLPSASAGQTEDVYGSSYPISDLPINFGNFLVTNVENNSGAAFPVSLDVTGSLNVQAGHTYIIQLLLTAGADQLSGASQQSVNFANTGAFSFTNLDGLIFTSSSGVFLSSTVPEPRTLPLLAAGLVTIAFAAKRRLR